MSVEDAGLILAVTWVSSLWIIPSYFVLVFMIPKRLVEIYFKEPHFKLGELVFMSMYPGKLMKAAIFTFATAFPWATKKRKMLDIRSHAPRWFIYFAKMYSLLAIFHGFMFFSTWAFYNYIDPNNTFLGLTR